MDYDLGKKLDATNSLLYEILIELREANGKTENKGVEENEEKK